jgi:hypothetical protein
VDFVAGVSEDQIPKAPTCGRGEMHFGRWAQKAIILAVLSQLCGCGVVASFNRMMDNDVGRSKAAYQTCLAEHPSDAATACENGRLIYQADVQAYSGPNRPERQHY